MVTGSLLEMLARNAYVFSLSVPQVSMFLTISQQVRCNVSVAARLDANGQPDAWLRRRGGSRILFRSSPESIPDLRP